MNADRLLALYEKVAEAPDAVPRMRRFVLDLAVRGNLVPQDPTDEPASELLKKITAEKARLVKAGEFREPRNYVEIKRDEPPFAPPAHWVWARLIDISRPSYGFAFKSSQFNGEKRGMPLIRIRDISKADTEAYYEGDYDPSYIVRAGDYLVGMDGDFNLRRWAGPDGLLNQRVMRITRWRCEIDPEFVKLPLQMVLDYLHGDTSLTTVKHLSAKQVNGIEVPLPPLAEQRRIVAKVDELMALLDRLEAARTAREATRDRLTAASLARLTAPEADPANFPANARFALATLPALTTRPDRIKPLRQTILNLAVRGKLVDQDPTDEPASELLKLMVKERKDTVARRKIRGATPPKAPSAETEGFTLPASWELCALGQITLITDPNPSHRYPDYSDGTVPILSTREFAGDGGWNPETAKLTTQAFWEFQKEICDFADGDIIFARKGRLGLPRFLPPFEKFTFSHTLFSIKPMTGLDPAYLLWSLRRDEVVAWLTSEMNQNTGVPTLGKAKTEKLPIPLPPLAEQHRIVAKVDALMALCDRLEAALTTADTTRARLLEALLHEALDPAAEAVTEAAE